MSSSSWTASTGSSNAIGIARRWRHIALQSVSAGIGLQEVIDVAVIVNALRALGRAG